MATGGASQWAASACLTSGIQKTSLAGLEVKGQSPRARGIRSPGSNKRQQTKAPLVAQSIGIDVPLRNLNHEATASPMMLQ